jgi:rSAM/selenodomain-associated transferase 1
MVFAKNVIRGRVKTRLARDTGDQKAMKVYRDLLHYTYNVTRRVDVDREIWYSSYIPDQPVFPSPVYKPRVQQGKDLGSRMKYAFQMAFQNGYKSVVIIGTDCAFLTADIIRQAFQYLKETRVVLGPSEDGGYYLLGMTRLYPFLFEQKSWSTPEVYSETIRDLDSHGIDWKSLPQLNDVDTWKDWQQARERLNKKEE